MVVSEVIQYDTRRDPDGEVFVTTIRSSDRIKLEGDEGS